jgi:hypothetical protein
VCSLSSQALLCGAELARKDLTPKLCRRVLLIEQGHHMTKERHWRIVLDGLHIRISCNGGIAVADEFRSSEPADRACDATEELIGRAEGANTANWVEPSSPCADVGLTPDSGQRRCRLRPSIS